MSEILSYTAANASCNTPYAARRRRLLAQLAALGDGVAILPTAPEVIRNRDAHFPYRFDSDFFYLTGFAEPEAVLVLVADSRSKTQQSILFCREKHEEREIWDGFRYGPAAACADFAFDAAYPINELAQRLPELIANHDTLWHSLGYNNEWDQQIIQALNTVRSQARAGKKAPSMVRDLQSLIHAMRLLKDTHEIALMREAARITSLGHLRAMQTCRPGMGEYALEAELSYVFRQHGAEAHAYTPIVAGGANACTLHYVANNQLLPPDGLVLIDAGCEYRGYAADITRTFPINGKFTAAQKDCYEIVLAAQQAAIAATHPGQAFMAPHEAAVKVLAQGMIDLGLLHGSLDGVLESESYKRFYMHRTGHWLGMDVHDVGEYKQGEEWMPLQPGMVLTIEPGLYIRPATDIPPHLAGIGIRIEDDALVTTDGCDLYTTAPKTVTEIEEVMRHD